MPQMGIPPSGGPAFQLLERKLQESASVDPADLKNGRVPEQADILMVASPETLDTAQLFAIDQFLMKGGTVVIAASPYKTAMGRSLNATRTTTGLEEWLDFQGLKLQDAMVLDPQNSAFPVPIERDVGGFKVRQIQLLDYPYFVDVRSDGMASGEAPTAGLAQMTLSWAAPIAIDAEKAKNRKITRLIESSAASWASGSTELLPDFKANGRMGFAETGEKKRQLLGAMMEGGSHRSSRASRRRWPRTPSIRKPRRKKSPKKAKTPEAKEKDKPASITGVIERSPESARIILLGSGSFLSDEVLELASSIDRTQYLAPVNFAQNLVDWSLEDRGLLALRSRGGQFSRTLRPIEASSQMAWEYSNYAFALLGLGLVHLIHRYARLSARRRRLAMLGAEGA